MKENTEAVASGKKPSKAAAAGIDAMIEEVKEEVPAAPEKIEIPADDSAVPSVTAESGKTIDDHIQEMDGNYPSASLP